MIFPTSRGGLHLLPAYAEVTYQFLPFFTGNLGLRFDDVYLLVAYSVDRGGTRGQAKIDKSYFLPMLNLKYDFSDKQILRLGISKTYTLPQSKEISLYKYIRIKRWKMKQYTGIMSASCLHQGRDKKVGFCRFIVKITSVFAVKKAKSWSRVGARMEQSWSEDGAALVRTWCSHARSYLFFCISFYTSKSISKSSCQGRPCLLS